MRRGVFGGTFDPVHNGHLAIADETRRHVQLDEVLFVPVGQPSLNKGIAIAASQCRVEMIRLAIEDRPFMKVSTIEVDRDGPSYTVDTLAELRGNMGDGDELFFIMGWDNLPQLPGWREPDGIMRLCRLVVVPRPGYPRPDIGPLEEKITGLSGRVIMLDRPEIDISASGIRERVAQGLPIAGLVLEAVEEYIRRHDLYSGRE